MLSNQDFVRKSLDANLFFLRIMKEHSIFIETAFTPKNTQLAQQADNFKNQFAMLLAQAVHLANGIVSPEVLASGEIVTNLTLNAERVSEFYTGVSINSNITKEELSLTGGIMSNVTPGLVQQVAELNHRAINATTMLADFKGRILNDVLCCKLFTTNYPLLIEHIRREALFFLNVLTHLQNRRELIISISEQEAFWNRIMAEHAKFIRGLLDPTEVQLFDTADNFGKIFDALTAQALASTNQPTALPQLTMESLRATINIRDFKTQGTEGLLACTVKAIAYPLLGDHVVREANHYIRLLNSIHWSYS